MKLLLVLAIVAGLVLDVSGRPKSKAQKELKCSACVVVANEMRSEVEHEWMKEPGATILIEKRKKKTKVPYRDSELAVQEAVDRVCEESMYKRYNVTKVNGKPRYVKTDTEARGNNKDHQKRLASVCQALIADHEQEIVDFFFTKRDVLHTTEKQICVTVAKLCTQEQLKIAMQPSAEGASVDSEEETEAEGGEDNGQIQAKVTTDEL